MCEWAPDTDRQEVLQSLGPLPQVPRPQPGEPDAALHVEDERGLVVLPGLPGLPGLGEQGEPQLAELLGLGEGGQLPLPALQQGGGRLRQVR